MSEYFEDNNPNDVNDNLDSENEIILQDDELIDDTNPDDSKDLDHEADLNLDDESADADFDNDEPVTSTEDDSSLNHDENLEDYRDDVSENNEDIKTTSDKVHKDVVKINEIKRIKKRRKLKPILISVVIFLLAVLVLTDIIPILPNAYNRFYVGNTYEIGETQGCIFDKFGKSVLYAGNGTVMSFGPDMTREFMYEIPLGSPKLETAGANAVVYFPDSNFCAVITNKDKFNHVETTNVITAATVNSTGYYGIVTKEAGRKSCIDVFDDKGESVYKYHTNSQIIDISISDNGKNLVASSFEEVGGIVCGKLIFMDMTSQNNGKESLVQSNLISEVKFVNSDTAVAFGDLYTVAYTGDGIEKWKIKYENKNPKIYDVSSNGDIVFVFNRDGSELSESTVEIYGTSGKLKGKYHSKNNIRYISANNDYVLLSLDKQTVLLDDEGDVVRKKNTPLDYKKAVLYSNYNFAFSITGGVSEIMSVKH